MNYCLDFSLRVEDELLKLTDEKCQELGLSAQQLSMDQEDELYDSARRNVLDSDGGKTWSEGDVRVGEFILIVDCDTRVV